MLSKQAIEEFQKIYSTTYGKKLSFMEATEQAHQVMRLYKAVLGYTLKIRSEDSKNDQDINRIYD